MMSDKGVHTTHHPSQHKAAPHNVHIVSQQTRLCCMRQTSHPLQALCMDVLHACPHTVACMALPSHPRPPSLTARVAVPPGSPSTGSLPYHTASTAHSLPLNSQPGDKDAHLAGCLGAGCWVYQLKQAPGHCHCHSLLAAASGVLILLRPLAARTGTGRTGTRPGPCPRASACSRTRPPA